MSTVAVMVPRGMPSALLRVRRRRRSRAAPRGGSPSSAGRSTGPVPRAEQRLRVVEEEEAEVEEARRRPARRRRGRASPARCQPRGRTKSVAVFSFSAVVLAVRRDVARSCADRVAQVRLAVDEVRPGRRVRVLEVRHEDVRARVERVDDHLAVDRAGDLDAAVEQVGGERRHGPVAGARLARGRGQLRRPPASRRAGGRRGARGARGAGSPKRRSSIATNASAPAVRTRSAAETTRSADLDPGARSAGDRLRFFRHQHGARRRHRRFTRSR